MQVAENKYVADYKRQPIYMKDAGTGGDIVYWNAGSGDPGENAGAFAGILDTTTVAGSYGAVECRGVFELTKGNGTAVKIEAGQNLYGSGATAVATAQVSTGSVIGLAWEQSSSDKSKVAVTITGNLSILHG